MLTTTFTTTSPHTTLQATGLSVAVTETAGRMLKITAVTAPYPSGGLQPVSYSLLRNGVSIETWFVSGESMSVSASITVSHVTTFTATGGAATYTLSMCAGSVTNTAVSDAGSAVAPRVLAVEDVGPVSGATLASAPTQDRWFSAWGVVASGTFVGTTVALPVSTLTQVTAALPFTSTSGRKYRVTLTSRAMAAGTTQAFLGVYLRDGTTPLNNQVLVYQPTAGFSPLNCTWKFDGDGTTKSYNCGITPTGGASTLYADNAYDTAFYIEDLGPVTGAAIIPSVAVTAWTALPLQTGFADFGSGHQPSQYRLIGDEVQVRGLLRRSGADVPTLTSTTIATLPTGYWPATTQTVPTVVATGSVLVGQLQVSTSGVISILMSGTLVTGSNLALNSISFSTIT